MADRIEQQFLIDAAAAIQTLQQLDAGFQTFENRLNSVAQSVNNFNAGIKSGGNNITSFRQQVQATAAAINKANASNQQLASSGPQLSGLTGIFAAISNNVGELYNRANKFGLTMETISRVALTQGLVRGFNNTRDAIVEATETAAEFQKKVALITTISGDFQDSNGIANEIKAISGAFNIPVLEAAEGVYNALSNQVGDFGESIKFTAEAAKFAKATNSSLADSVNVLSAVIKAYGLSAADTNRIASVLFTTIDEGRVVASELGNSLGRVLPSAVTLGVSLEEVSAAMSLISVKGLNSAETLTRVNALFSTLLKPSDALKATYKDLNIETAELGIRQFGLAGFLKKVMDAGGETSAELAKLAPNIRGLGGIIGVTSDGIDEFTAAVKRNEEAGVNDAIGTAFAKMETDAELLSRTMNNTRLVLQEYGEAIITTFADAVRAVDDFSQSNPDAVAAAKHLGAGMATAAAAVVSLQGSVVLLSVGMKTLNFLFLKNPAIATAVGIGVLTGAVVSYIDATVEAKAQADLSPFLDVQKQNVIELAGVTKQSADTFEQQFGRINKTVSTLLTGAQPAKEQYQRAIEGIKRSNVTLEDSTDLALDRIIGARRSYVQELARAAKEADDIVKDSQARIADLRAGQADRTFDAQLSGLGDAQQVLKLTQRAAAISAKAAADLEAAGRSGNKEAIDAALRQFNRAQGIGQEAQEIAKRTGNRALEANTARDLNAITSKQIAAEETLTASQAKRKALAEQERRQQELLLKNLERQAKIVLENTGQFNDKGERFSDKELAVRSQNRDRAIGELISAQFKKGDFDLASVLGLAKFTADFKAELSQGASTLKQDLSRGDLGVTQSINDALQTFNADIFVQRLKGAVGKEGGLLSADDLISPTQLETFSSNLADRAKNLAISLRGLTDNTKARDNAKEELDSFLQGLEARATSDSRLFTDMFGGNYKAVGDGFRDAAAELREFGKDGQFTKEEIDQIKVSMDELDKTTTKLKDSFFGLGNSDFRQYFLTDEKLLEQALLSIKKIQEAQTLINDSSQNGDPTSQLQEIETLLQDVKSATPVQQTLDVSNNLQSAVDYAAKLRDATISAATAMQAYVNASGLLGGSNVVQNHQFGSAMLQYFNSGGMARGMDTINAMVAPGESIINAKQTARFYSQIQAMNAGQLPVFRAQAGAVTNVGDINVSVRGGESSGQTARQIATELRRELRRGTSRF